jgi:hypothetical protein
MAFPLYDSLNSLNCELGEDSDLLNSLNSLSEEKIGDTRIALIIHLLILHHSTKTTAVDFWGKNKSTLPYDSKAPIGGFGLLYKFDNIPVELKKILLNLVRTLT